MAVISKTAADATPRANGRSATNHPCPTLESGDRLTADEFDRIYDQLPNVKAELIHGVVYVASPARSRVHGRPHAIVVKWAGRYVDGSVDVELDLESTLKLPDDTRVQPDVLLSIVSEAGGISKLPDDDYLVGPVEFIAEVAATSASKDLHDKLDVYQQYGVREYMVWRTMNRAIDWFILRDGKYVPIVPEGGILKSVTLPGLWLDPAAMIANDRKTIAAVLDAGLASPEHAAFVAKLAAARR
jgi:Uma2 family endonuclease